MNIKQICLKFLMCYLNYINQYLCEEISKDTLRVEAQNVSVSRVMGIRTQVGEFSYSVIFYEDKLYHVDFGDYRSPICSGNVLTTRWVLTTATPLGGYSLKDIRMFAGVMRQYSIPVHSESEYRIDRMIIHHQWHVHKHKNLGLARTTEDIILGIGLSTVRIPFNFKFASNNKTLLCKMPIWASDRRHHLMGKLQSTRITKQSVEFKVSDEFQPCPNYFPNETFCLLQYNDSRIDLCSVNLGSGITCGFGIVGMLTGGKDFIGCVDRPPLTYSVVNLYGYIDWITEVIDQKILGKNITFHTISCSDLVLFNFRLLSLGQLFLYFNVLNVY